MWSLIQLFAYKFTGSCSLYVGIICSLCEGIIHSLNGKTVILFSHCRVIVFYWVMDNTIVLQWIRKHGIQIMVCTITVYWNYAYECSSFGTIGYALRSIALTMCEKLCIILSISPTHTRRVYNKKIYKP